MLRVYDPKSGENREEALPFIHLCPHADCQCEDDVLRGRLPGNGVMLPPVPRWFQEHMEENNMGFKRPNLNTPVKPMANAWNDAADRADYPNVFGFLTETTYDDGKPRMTGSISIFTQLGVLKASVSDRDNKRNFYVEALTLHELIGMIEQGICDDNTEWRNQQPFQKTPPY